MDQSSKQKAGNATFNEELYTKMVGEVSDYAILMLDTNGTILNWNKGAQVIKGYSADEIVGKNFRVFYTAEDRENKLPESLLGKALQDGRVEHEGWRLKKDGSTFWGLIVITALHGDDDTIIGFSKVTRDLTEKKKAEDRAERYAAELLQNNEKLRQSEERYHRMISEVVDYAIIMLDMEGNIMNWNKGAENIKGYTEQEIVGKNFRIFYLEKDQQENLPQQLLDIATTVGKASHEGWRVRKDGTWFWGSIVITALHDNSGAVIGYSKVTRDLTEKKHFEDQIILKNKQLEEYAYVASHDLQEPLRKILTFSNLMHEHVRENEPAMVNLQKINVAVERMSNLIKSVLTYSRADNDQDLFANVDLNVTIRNIETDFEVLLKEKNGKISYDNLPILHAIPIQMHQLFSNLISNAIKFNENQPLIRIEAKPAEVLISGDNRDYVLLTVSDNGIGFDQNLEEKAFRMFHRLHSNKLGTGIGLALCKKITENHEGTIHAVSQTGKGTVFEIVLPVGAAKKD